ncbi:phage tail tip lysozyme, partial [Methylobacterium sp. J-070]|uniref:phage tail tip lysozyme n=1 Tax=Methylobacterium sp. J-070 TaxID=2836650 RepID=UPI001FB9A307
TVAEAFFGLWVATKVGAVLAQIGLIRAALVTGNTSLLAAMLRVGLPVAIGAVATGHGYQTPEEAAADPDQAQLQREGIERRGRVRGAISKGWNSVKRMFGGGEAEAADGGAGIRTRARRAARGVEADPSGDYTGNDGRRSRGATSAQGRANVASWMEFLQKPVSEGGLGMPRGKAQASIAMMQGESGGNLDPGAVGDSGHAHGTAQWSDANGNPRFPLLKKFAASQNKDWRDRGVQQQYFRMEMLGLPGAVSHNHAYRAMMAAPTDEQTLYQGISKFENPQKHALAYQIRKPFLDRLRRIEQHDQDIATIQAAGKDLRSGASNARRPDVLADPKDERRQVPAAAPAPSAWNGIPNAGLFVAQAQAAQAAQIANTTNDNRQSSVRTDTTHMHGDVIVNSSASNADGLIGDLKQSLKGRAYAMSSNTGQA